MDKIKNEIQRDHVRYVKSRLTGSLEKLLFDVHKCDDWLEFDNLNERGTDEVKDIVRKVMTDVQKMQTKVEELSRYL